MQKGMLRYVYVIIWCSIVQFDLDVFVQHCFYNQKNVGKFQDSLLKEGVKAYEIIQCLQIIFSSTCILVD